MSSTPKASKAKKKAKDKRTSSQVTDSGSDRNVTTTPKRRLRVAMNRDALAPPTPSESGGSALWLILLTVVTGLIAIFAVSLVTLTAWSR
jgi:hypothetical protein